ncbi:MAG TPA: RHS repeat-associated core domain-containing protein [Rickettsiales bacterium]|nr:RHS repeat-associated core domain-containing protein [Rickettsiales bacterium]
MPFGEDFSLTASVTNNMRFPGQYVDTEFPSLVNNGFRTYDPTLGRYDQDDPIGLNGGINSFAYVGNNPMKGVDPSGQFVQFIALCAASPACMELSAAALIFTGNAAYQYYENGSVNWADAAANASFAFNGGVPSGGAGAAAEEGGMCAGSSLQYKLLKDDLTYQEAASNFTNEGTLTQQTLSQGQTIIPNSSLGNKAAFPAGVDKNVVNINTPHGPAQVHYYQNPATGQTYYGQDYKVIFNNPLGR